MMRMMIHDECVAAGALVIVVGRVIDARLADSAAERVVPVLRRGAR